MLSMLYAMLCILLPCATYQAAGIKKHKGKKYLVSHILWIYIFLLYIFFALSIAGIGSIWDIGHYDTVIRVEEINLIPFQSEGIMTYILNVIMFMPFGFLLPLIWKQMRNPIKISLTGFSFSLAIELCQLFNHRNTDIDDLLMNTLGSFTGYFLWKLLRNFFKKTDKKAITLSEAEPFMYLTLAVLGEFLLYNWRLL